MTSIILIQITLLLMVSVLIRYQFLQPRYSSVAAGAIVMAIGIFILDVIPNLNDFFKSLTQPFALELLIIWSFIAGSYFKRYLNNELYIYNQDYTNYFAVGTWVAGTAVLDMVLIKVFPSWQYLHWGLAVIALMIWLWYIKRVLYYLIILLKDSTISVNGTIFLSTVSTQSIVMLLYFLFSGKTYDWVEAFLFIFGLVMYCVGLIFIFRSYYRIKLQNIILNWSHSNCILHGAVSISGFAGICIGILTKEVMISLWAWAVAMFVFNEGISCLRLWKRINQMGLIRGIVVYDVSQWVRIFTFAMFYSFNTAISHATIDSSMLVDKIAAYGQFFVLLILLIEITLFFKPISK